jgi:hypothetical protein
MVSPLGHHPSGFIKPVSLQYLCSLKSFLDFQRRRVLGVSSLKQLLFYLQYLLVKSSLQSLKQSFEHQFQYRLSKSKSLLAFGIFDADCSNAHIHFRNHQTGCFFSGSYFVFRLISRFVASSLSICFWISSSSILAKAIPLQFGVQW